MCSRPLYLEYWTDWSCILPASHRVTVNGSSRFYIREMKNLFVVGQTIPSVQVPGPHARKVSATAKDRTHQIAYRLLQKAKGNHMKLSRLMKYFPDCHELQMRQRLKVRLASQGLLFHSG